MINKEFIQALKDTKRIDLMELANRLESTPHLAPIAPLSEDMAYKIAQIKYELQETVVPHDIECECPLCRFSCFSDNFSYVK